MKHINVLNVRLPVFWILLAALIAGATIFFVLNKEVGKEDVLGPKRDLEGIIKDLTAPGGEVPAVPEKTKKLLTAPGGKNAPNIPEEIIESLTAPE
ncbi:MAG: hypothetical protein HYW70_02580 [Candidatus Nealsonbacteria bacterium]|nr:hypothetical protein [Candidatus Nealsonbacteria bacterium]